MKKFFANLKKKNIILILFILIVLLLIAIYLFNNKEHFGFWFTRRCNRRTPLGPQLPEWHSQDNRTLAIIWQTTPSNIRPIDGRLRARADPQLLDTRIYQHFRQMGGAEESNRMYAVPIEEPVGEPIEQSEPIRNNLYDAGDPTAVTPPPTTGAEDDPAQVWVAQHLETEYAPPQDLTPELTRTTTTTTPVVYAVPYDVDVLVPTRHAQQQVRPARAIQMRPARGRTSAPAAQSGDAATSGAAAPRINCIDINLQPEEGTGFDNSATATYFFMDTYPLLIAQIQARLIANNAENRDVLNFIQRRIENGQLEIYVDQSADTIFSFPGVGNIMYPFGLTSYFDPEAQNLTPEDSNRIAQIVELLFSDTVGTYGGASAVAGIPANQGNPPAMGGGAAPQNNHYDAGSPSTPTAITSLPLTPDIVVAQTVPQTQLRVGRLRARAYEGGAGHTALPRGRTVVFRDVDESESRTDETVETGAGTGDPEDSLYEAGATNLYAPAHQKNFKISLIVDKEGKLYEKQYYIDLLENSMATGNHYLTYCLQFTILNYDTLQPLSFVSEQSGRPFDTEISLGSGYSTRNLGTVNTLETLQNSIEHSNIIWYLEYATNQSRIRELRGNQSFQIVTGASRLYQEEGQPQGVLFAQDTGSRRVTIDLFNIPEPEDSRIEREIIRTTSGVTETINHFRESPDRVTFYHGNVPFNEQINTYRGNVRDTFTSRSNLLRIPLFYPLEQEPTESQILSPLPQQLPEEPAERSAFSERLTDSAQAAALALLARYAIRPEKELFSNYELYNPIPNEHNPCISNLRNFSFCDTNQDTGICRIVDYHKENWKSTIH